jgi:hypothetical protein
MMRKICYKKGHRGIALNVPAGREPTMDEVRRIHARRNARERGADDARRSKHVIRPNERGKASWVNNPTKWDIDGLDTPRRGRPKSTCRTRGNVRTCRDRNGNITSRRRV